MGAAISTYSYTVVSPVQDSRAAKMQSVRLKPSTTFAAGTLLGELTASLGVMAAYASGNSDGSQNPSAVLPFDCITDASGNITKGSSITAGGDQYGITDTTVAVYISGEFLLTDIPNQDAAGIAKCGHMLPNGHCVLTGA